MGLQYGNAIGGIIKISPIEFVPKDTLFGGIFGSYHDNGKLNSSSLRLNKIKKNGFFDNKYGICKPILNVSYLREYFSLVKFLSYKIGQLGKLFSIVR